MALLFLQQQLKSLGHRLQEGHVWCLTALTLGKDEAGLGTASASLGLTAPTRARMAQQELMPITVLWW